MCVCVWFSPRYDRVILGEHDRKSSSEKIQVKKVSKVGWEINRISKFQHVYVYVNMYTYT